MEKYPCIIAFAKLKMFRQEDNKEQSVSIIGISIAKHFFLDIEVASFLAYWAFLHIFACLGYVSVY